MTALISLLNTLAPVFLVVLLGAILRHTGFLTEAFSTALNRFVFWVSLPVFLFLSIQKSSFVEGCLPAALVMILTTLAIAAISWFGAPLFGISRWSRGTFCQSVFRSNNAYVGMPVMSFAFAGLPVHDDVMALAALSLAPCLILYNVLAVLVLTPNALGLVTPDPTIAAAHPAFTRRALTRKILLGIAKNPLILACITGSIALLLRQRAHVNLPEFLARTLTSIGALAGPGALLALGASLTPERLLASLRGGHIATALKLLLCPAIGALFVLLFNLASSHLGWPLALDANARFVALAYLTCPTAVASFVMAQAMKGDPILSAGTVALSTLYSVPALSLILLLFGPQ